MRQFLKIAGMAACLTMSGMGAATAEPRLLSQVLEKCNGDEAGCLHYFANELSLADEYGFACVPQAVTYEAGAKDLVAWLRARAASDPEFIKLESVDAQIVADKALWPCQ